MQAIPADIRNLSHYFVSQQLFICTSIIMAFFLSISILIAITWIYRSCKHIHNYEYIPQYEFINYYRNRKEKIRNDDPEDIIVSESQRQSVYNAETQQEHQRYNRNESRFLEFMCLSVVVIININAFASTAFETIAFFAAAVLFLIFNIFRIIDKQWLRLLFFIPLIVTFIPFYSESKELQSI